jgi:NIMA (never in mitosis gene a)-related kinase
MSQLRGYQVIELLGQGTYGRVYKVLRKSDQQVVVLKSVPFQGMSAQEQQETLNEVRVMAQVQHAHVIQYLDSFLENGVLNIVMEYAPVSYEGAWGLRLRLPFRGARRAWQQGDLAQKLEERRRQARPFSESDLWEYFVDVALGLKHLHEKRILHRDIKPHNIFLDANGRAKVGDLGLGRMLGSKSVHARSGVG